MGGAVQGGSAKLAALAPRNHFQNYFFVVILRLWRLLVGWHTFCTLDK
jgi:hypothetical protein